MDNLKRNINKYITNHKHAIDNYTFCCMHGLFVRI